MPLLKIDGLKEYLIDSDFNSKNIMDFSQIIDSRLSPRPKFINYMQNALEISNSNLNNIKIQYSKNSDSKKNDLILKFINQLLAEFQNSGIAISKNMKEITIECIRDDKALAIEKEFLKKLKEIKYNTDEYKQVQQIYEKSLENEEGYILEISRVEKHVIIYGKTYKGIFYGIQTLYQLVLDSREMGASNSNSYSGTSVKNLKEGQQHLLLPSVLIFDYPDMEIRGISDDISRGQVGHVENVKEFIRFLSRFKLNTYMFYSEDMFRFKKYPEIGRQRGAYTQEEIRELQDYAEQYCVNLIPIVQTLGHMETYFLTPKFVKYAEFRGSACLNPANPESYEFLSNLLEKVATMFKSENIHIGCDETREIGWLRSKKLVEEIGIGNVYLRHYNWCIDKLTSLGKKRIFLYSDIAAKYKEVLEGINKKNAIFVVWDYSIKKHYSRMDPVIEWNLPFVVSSSTLNWRKIIPNFQESIESNQRLIEEGLKHGAIGQICSSWGDNGNEDLRANRLFGFAAASSMSWSFKQFDQKIFERAFFKERLCFRNLQLEEFEELWDLILEFPKRLNINKSKTLSNFYEHLWRHPFSREIHGNEFDKGGSEYSESFLEEHRPYLNKIIDLCEKISKQIKNNSKLMKYRTNYVDYLQYAAEATLMLINKIQTTKKVEKIVNKYEHRYKNKPFSELEKKEIFKLIDARINEFSKMREKYKTLWLACAREPRLPEILRYFDWMIYWYEEKREQIANNITYKSPFLIGDWIAYDDDFCKTYEPRYFKKEFDITKSQLESIDKAYVQMIAAAYGTLWINGIKIGSAPEIPTSTGLLMDNRELFKELDKSIFREGKNQILIEAITEQGGFPVANLFLKINFKLSSDKNQIKTQTKTRPLVIFTNTSWRSSKSKNADDKDWIRAISKGKPPYYMGEVYMPNFEKGWHSRYSLYRFGAIINSIAAQKTDQISPLFERFWLFNYEAI
ncbi:MAG: family 20 glycosylhydrolase [Promethearchaeota archaeon]